jgi:hypothetical protein
VSTNPHQSGKKPVICGKGDLEMTENTEKTGNIRDEFRNLGDNLKQVFQTAWESDERKKLQSDVRDGLNDVSAALNEALNSFQTSEAGKKIVEGVEDVGEAFRSGEVEAKTREGILNALKKLNEELEKAAGKFTVTPEEEEQEAQE